MTHARWRISLELVLLAVVILLAGSLRMYHFSWPVADWHSFRQADTASVTREYVKHGIDILRPRYQDLSNIQSGKDNLEGWRMVEFPIVNAGIAAVVRANPTLDLVETSRAASILASLLSLLGIWWIGRSLWGKATGLVAAVVFAVMPYNVYYSRAILPEPFVVLAMVLAAVALERFVRTRSSWRAVWIVIYGVFFALALLLKPFAAFFLAWYGGLVWQLSKRRVLDLGSWLLVSAGGFVPLYFWRKWILQFPSGIPASSWLFNQNGIRLKPAWWRWLFGDRLGRLMFGHWATLWLGLGMVAGVPAWPKKTQSWWKAALQWVDAWLKSDASLLGMMLGVVAYFVVIATGNVQHDYYQVITVPFFSLLCARGMVSWVQEKDRAQFMARVAVLLFTSGLALAFAWYEIEGFYHINNPAIVEAGKAVDRIVPADALVIAPGFGDTAFLFQTNRRGWPIGFEIEDKRAKGAQFYVTTAKDDEANMLLKQYPLIEETPTYLILDIRTAKK